MATRGNCLIQVAFKSGFTVSECDETFLVALKDEEEVLVIDTVIVLIYITTSHLTFSFHIYSSHEVSIIFLPSNISSSNQISLLTTRSYGYGRVHT